MCVCVCGGVRSYVRLCNIGRVSDLYLKQQILPVLTMEGSDVVYHVKTSGLIALENQAQEFDVIAAPSPSASHVCHACR